MPQRPACLPHEVGVVYSTQRTAQLRMPTPARTRPPPSQMSIILINLLLGPPLFRLALLRVGEVKNIPASGELRAEHLLAKVAPHSQHSPAHQHPASAHLCCACTHRWRAARPKFTRRVS